MFRRGLTFSWDQLKTVKDFRFALEGAFISCPQLPNQAESSISAWGHMESGRWSFAAFAVVESSAGVWRLGILLHIFP